MKAKEIMNPLRDLDEFTRAYIECALWSSNDESTPEGGEPMDLSYSWTDIAHECLQQMMDDCVEFQAKNAAMLVEESWLMAGSSVLAHAGHDFWLTRCGHGAGFWDGDWEEEAGKLLTKSAQEFGEMNLYVGDDGRIYS